MDRFHIAATGHSLNYLPEYVAMEQDFFAEEGLAISVEVPKPWDLVLDRLGDGSAEAALGGIWVPSMHHRRGMRLVPFAQVSARAPLALLGREPDPMFDVSRLVGKTVSMKGSNGASVGLYLKMLLREAGIDPRQVNYIQDLDAGILSRCFAGGMGDYLLVDLPGAMALEAMGIGAVVARFAETGGNIPWSVYYRLGEWSEKDDRPTRFCRSLKRGMAWIMELGTAEDLRPLLARLFPALDAGLSVQVVEIYRRAGMWTTPRIDPDAYARWQAGICGGFLTQAPIPYDELIDSRPATATTAR
jgi:NitT/TauT family transport system substrate-binding protein